MSTTTTDTSNAEDGEVDLPVFMEKLTVMKTINETAEFLKVLNKKEFVKKLFSSSNNLEETFYDQLYKKVSRLFSIKSDEIRNENLIEELNAFGPVLEFFEHSIEVSRGFATCDRTFDLIQVVFKLIESSFSLYHDHGIGDDVSTELKRSLDSVFEKTVSLTKTSVSLLDHLIKTDSNLGENKMETIINVCRNVKRICHLFESITSKPAISIWKCYTNILLKYSDQIGDRVDVVDTCEQICLKITSMLANLRESSKSKHTEVDSVRCLQLCGFFCKILKAICDKYRSHLGDAFPSLLKLILTLYGYSVANLEGYKLPDSLRAEVEVHITVIVEPLAVQLTREKQFLSLVKVVDVKDGNRVQICLLLLFILENLTTFDDESLDVLMDYGKEKSILDTFFKVFSDCFVPLSLPVYLKGVQLQGKPQRLVSFYEYTCTKLCAVVTLFPSRYFQKLEFVLLQSLVSSKEMWQSLLAVDVWSYLGRLESSEMCYGHFIVIARIVDSMDPIPNGESWCITLLLRRLYGFLSIEQKIAFTNKFSVARHRTLWMYLLESDIEDEIWNVLGGRQKLFRQHLDGLEKCLTETSSAPVVTLQNMYYHLVFVTKLCSESDLKVSTTLKSRALDVALRILAALPSEVDSATAELIVSKLISILGHLVPIYRNSDLDEILPKFLKLYRCGGHIIRLNILRFITNLKRKRVEKPEVLRTLTELVTISLKEENPIIFHHALDSFSEFSHETPNVRVISDCFVLEPLLKDVVVNFLNQVPMSSSECRGYEDIVKNSSKLRENAAERDRIETEKDTEKEEFDENYRTAIEEVKKSVNKLVNMLEAKDTTVPSWFGTEIEKILTKMNKVKNYM